MSFSSLLFVTDNRNSSLKEKLIDFFNDYPCNFNHIYIEDIGLTFNKILKTTKNLSHIIFSFTDRQSINFLQQNLIFLHKNIAKKIVIRFEISDRLNSYNFLKLWHLAHFIDFECLYVDKCSKWISSYCLRNLTSSNLEKAISDGITISEEEFWRATSSTFNAFALDSNILAPCILSDMRVSIFRTKYDHFSPNSGPAVPFRILNKRTGIIASSRSVTLKHDMDRENLHAKNSQALDNKYQQYKTYLEEIGQKVIFKNMIVQEAEELFNCINSNRTNLLHFIDGEHAGLLSLMLRDKVVKSTNKLRIISTFHQPFEVLQQIYPLDQLKNFDGIQVLSPCQYNSLAEYGVPTEKLSLIPHASPFEIYSSQFSNSQIRTNDKFTFITVGNWQRDYEILNKIIDSLIPDKHFFHIVASKKNLPSKLITDNHSNVIIHNNISDQKLSQLYSSSDFLLLPLKHSTANNAILESLAHGLPVITTDSISTRYYVKDCGFFIKNNNLDLYIDSIKFVQTLTLQEIKILKQKAFERSRFLSLKKTLERTILMYFNILNGRESVVIK